MADTTVPEPKENGLYSASLLEDFERLFIRRVQNALAQQNFEAGVGIQNAGQLLFVIGQEAALLQSAGLPKWPDALSTLESCNDYVECQTDFERVLREVHEKRAYAWLVENVVGQTVEQPTLREYLFPHANFLDAQIPPVHTRYVRGSTTTAPFAPRLLDRNRLPFLVRICERLPQKMKSHLQELLESQEEYRKVANRPATEYFRHTHGSLVRTCHQRNNGAALANKADVQSLAEYIAAPVTQAYHDLTGDHLHSSPQVPSFDNAVVTDRTYRLDDENGNNVILWDDKRPKAGKHYTQAITRLLRRGDISFDGDHDNTEWEGEKAVLGKFAWHATEEENSRERPRWAVLFGGNQYIVLLLAYFLDARNERLRPALFCSPVMSIHDSNFPVVAVTLYMALSSSRHFTQKKLLNTLGIPTPDRPEVLPPPDVLPKMPTAGKRSLSKTNGLGLHSPGTQPFTMSRITSAAVQDMIEKDEFRRDNFVLTDVAKLPAVFLSGSALEGAVGTVYRTTSGVIIKFAHRDTEARRSLLREAETYRVLGENRIPSIPTFYGLFASRQDFALILSHEGESLEDFSELSQQQRVDLFATLKKIHKARIIHGDFEPRNVLLGPQGLIIVDFSHSDRHDCSGSDTCEELVDARDEIWKENDSNRTSSNRPSRSPSQRRESASGERLGPIKGLNIGKWLAVSTLAIGFAAWFCNTCVTCNLLLYQSH